MVSPEWHALINNEADAQHEACVRQ